jgi:hypothetical protein
MQQALPQAPTGYYMADQSRRYRVVGEADYWLDESDDNR